MPTYSPPEAVRKNAQRALEWRREYNRGGTDIGVARARDLSNGKMIPVETLKRMVSFFARHAVDKQAEGFFQGEKGFPSPGRIAWDLWGGDAGYKWSKSVLRREGWL